MTLFLLISEHCQSNHLILLFHGNQCVDSLNLAKRRAWEQDTGGTKKAAGLQTIF